MSLIPLRDLNASGLGDFQPNAFYVAAIQTDGTSAKFVYIPWPVGCFLQLDDTGELQEIVTGGSSGTIPLSCMDLATVAPLVFDPTAKTITVSAATGSAAGSMSGADKTRLDSIFAGTTLQYVRGDGTLATLATVATSGAYSSLSGLPTLGTAAATNSTAYDASGAAASAQAASQPLALILTNLAAQSGTTGLPRKTGAATWTLDTSTFLTGNQTLTLSGDVTGSGTTAITATLKNTGTASTYTGVTTDAQGRVTAGTSQVVNNTPTVPLVTTAAAANGTQISATQSALVSYSVTTSSTSTIAGASSVVAVLEICPTNSATAANWLTIATVQNGQTLTLAVALQAVQTLSQGLAGVVPAGYYRRIRYTVTGTGSAVFASGQETLQ